MGNLKVHDKLDIQAGGQVEVLDEFGSGGQGTVYKVSYNGKTYALKWYHLGVFKGKENDFYKNLENNISNGAPTDAFLWPKAITKVYNDQFGYLMDVRPSGYEELTNFFVGGESRNRRVSKVSTPSVRQQSILSKPSVLCTIMATVIRISTTATSSSTRKMAMC